ncbi:sensor histidine kinase [Gammaproteobacteria bacterium AB-CW1]|uniref:Sensor histidine kinase n=2 Tax=Natronospira TaxID=2024969 RepID=A0AAP6JJH5_9GAMM|nr:sensor histidine kinase [Gammaproteobacteria bacterium AB-CW1]
MTDSRSGNQHRAQAKAWARPLLAIHRRLLPDDREIGWTPYLWLVYLSFFFIEWFFRPVPVWELALSGLALAVFIGAYFRSFWVGSRQRLRMIVLTTLIGLAITPINSGGIVFFIYAAATAGTLLPRSLALGTMAAVILVVLAQSAYLGLPLQYWLVGTVIGGFVGLANLYYTGVSSENAALRLSQQEVQALAATRERERISRDLHDLLGQSLALMSLKAQLARRLIDRDPQQAEAELHIIEEQAREALQQVRDAVRGYRRASLASESADAHLSLVSQEVEFDYELPEQPLPADVDAELALVLREAVTNVLRHSRAEHCRLTVRPSGQDLHFHFSDDGNPGMIEEGNGLSGMRQRIAGLGGRFHVSTEQGLHIQATLPNALATQTPSGEKDKAA